MQQCYTLIGSKPYSNNFVRARNILCSQPFYYFADLFSYTQQFIQLDWSIRIQTI